MKTKVYPSFAVLAALLAVVPASWSQSTSEQAQVKQVKPSSGAKPAAVSKAGPAAKTEEASRQEKAAQTAAALHKKMDETAKTVTGNLK